jgi:prolyl oligopeptidase
MNKTAVVLLLAGCATANDKSPETAAAPAPAVDTPPATKKEPVSDQFHGTTVSEDYRWLEPWDAAPVQAWTGEQNAYARKHLDALPAAAALRAELSAIMKTETEAYADVRFTAGLLFAQKHAPPKQQDLLIATTDARDAAKTRVVVDPNVIDESGKTSIDWYVPSWDGKLVAVSLSRAGTESGDVHVFDVATGKEVHEVIPRANGGTAGGDLAWAADNKGFYYTRYPRGTERPTADMQSWVQLYYHALGTPTEKDRYEIGKDFPRIAEIQVRVDQKSARVLATVQNGDGGDFNHYLRDAKGAWKQIAAYSDQVKQVVFGAKDDLYALSRKDAPRGKLLRLSAKDLSLAKAATIIPEGEDTLVDGFWGSPTIIAGPGRLYVTVQTGGPSVIRSYDLAGKPALAPQQPEVAAVSDLTAVGGDDVVFRVTSFVRPSAILHFAAAGAATTTTALVATSPASFDGIEVVREVAVSKDGTKVPVNILAPKGTTLDGSHPLILYGYGGYGVSMTPRFQPTLSVLLKHGVLYAIANLRGGAEFGEAWHTAGNLTKKQNVFDDFTAVAEHLVARGWTTKAKLGLRGGSNGGLLMGATLTQHPALARVVVSHVGIYDMLRYELEPNGAFNTTEFGSVKDPAQFAALHAYSPYHRVTDGTAYPALLLMTGANDPRVSPANSRKFAARLQAANAGGGPILLRTSLDTGHGGGTPVDAQIDELVDEMGFYFRYLGVTVPEAAEASAQR